MPHCRLQILTKVPQKPGNLCHSDGNRAALDELMQNEAIKQIAGHASSKQSLPFRKLTSTEALCSCLRNLGPAHPPVLS